MANEDMSNIIEQLSSMINNNNNIPDNMKDMLNNMKSSNNDNSSSDNTSSNSAINPDMITNLVNMFSNTNSDKQGSSSSDHTEDSSPAIDFEMIMKMKTIIDKMNTNKEDPRANLLKSLKPYLKESRKEKVDQYIKLFNMSKVMEVFNSSGGDKEK